MYRRFVGSSQTSNALDCARRLRFIGLIVDLNVPGLCEPRSPFPGNGILRAEIKAPKQRLDSETPSTETKRARVSPPIGGFWNADGKSLVARECVVADAVCIEPVSNT